MSYSTKVFLFLSSSSRRVSPCTCELLKGTSERERSTPTFLAVRRKDSSRRASVQLAVRAWSRAFSPATTMAAPSLPRMALVERRCHPMAPREAYTLEQFKEFARKQYSAEEAQRMAHKMWMESVAVLYDHAPMKWSHLWDLCQEKNALMIFCSAPRFVHDELKPAIRALGAMATFGRPGDAMHGLGGSEYAWLDRWIVKNVAAAGAANVMGKEEVLLVFFNADPNSGTQEEFSRLDDLRGRILHETGLVASATLVDGDDVVGRLLGKSMQDLQKMYDEDVQITGD